MRPPFPSEGNKGLQRGGKVLVLVQGQAQLALQAWLQWQGHHPPHGHRRGDGVARQQSERVSTLTPANQFSFYSSYRLGGSLSGLTLGGGARWQDKTWGDVSHPTQGTVKHTVDSYWLFDAMASYQIDKNLSVNLNVNNLLDKKYYTIFSYYSTYTWGEPRSVTLAMNYKF